MHIVLVQVHVIDNGTEAFVAASRANAEASRKEPGVVRFDVLQQRDDPTRFVLVEVYRAPEAAVAHKATDHYATWRDAVAPLMAEPRSGTSFTNVSPGDEDW